MVVVLYIERKIQFMKRFVLEMQSFIYFIAV